VTRKSVFTHDILPRIQAGHPVLSIITHEWEVLRNRLLDVSESLNRRFLRWSTAHRFIREYITDSEGRGRWEDLRGPDNKPLTLPIFDDAHTMTLSEEGIDYISGRVQRVAPDYLLWWYQNQTWLHESILWVEDLTPYLDMTGHSAASNSRRDLVRRIRSFCEMGPSVKNKTVVMSFPENYLPSELEKDVEQFSLPLPDTETLDIIFQMTFRAWNKQSEIPIKSPSNAIQKRMVTSALGLTVQEATSAFKQIFARINNESPVRDQILSKDIQVVNEQKAQIINKTGVLEYVHTDDSIKDIGGMKNLKKWLTVHKSALDDEMDPPKGLLMMGVPGCGKSLMARAVAADWELPLLALKASNIFDKYVGESEGKISRALAIAEAISPCVLWIDEIEKLLAGSGGDGSNDSGVSARLGGSILTWMSDKKSPVFVVATANNPERLDPAYVRRGRFDERFFIDLPGEKARLEIFQHHLQKRFPDANTSAFELEFCAQLSNGFTGAEIEAVVVEAKNTARAEKVPVSKEILLQCLRDMTPDSVAMTDTIEHIRNLWGGDRARRADDEDPVDLKLGKAFNKEIHKAVQENTERLRRF
jgi:SpoVK/Ycf46/Vps4 family AAA+-type ATPase